MARFWYRDGLCEKLPEASPMSNRANAAGSRMSLTRLSPSPAVEAPLDNAFKKGKKLLHNGDCSWREE